MNANLSVNVWAQIIQAAVKNIKRARHWRDGNHGQTF